MPDASRQSGSREGGAAASARVQFIGGPTAVVEMGGLRLLTDPTFSPPGQHESAPGRFLTKTEGPGLLREAVGRVDAVLLSHDHHADNLDPAGREFIRTVPLVLTTESGAGRLGGTARALRSWETVSLPRPEGGTLEIIGLPARHGPPGCEPITGEVTGFLLRGKDLPTVYFSGDNAALEYVTEIVQRVGPVEVALLSAGGAKTSLVGGAPLTMTSDDAAEAARILSARWVVPLHVRGWAHFSEGPGMLQGAFEKAGLASRLRWLAPGESAAF